MKTNRSNNRSLKQNSNRLAAYLATGIGAGIVATPAADAAIITIDLASSFYFGGNLGSVNAGVNYGGGQGSAFPVYPGYTSWGLGVSYGGGLGVHNNILTKGINGDFGLGFAASSSNATPTNFTAGQVINSSANFVGSNSYYSLFKMGSSVSPDFGSGSYMGFKTYGGRYGWMEVTWASATGQFQVLSAAYEDVIGTGISAGDTGGSAAVPEPAQVASSLLLLALGAAGVAIQRQRAKKKQAAVLA